MVTFNSIFQGCHLQAGIPQQEYPVCGLYQGKYRQILSTGIVSRDLGGVLIILLGRLEVFNISASRFFLFSLPFSYSNFKNGRLSGASFSNSASIDLYSSGD